MITQQAVRRALQFRSAEYDGAALLRQLSGEKNSTDSFEGCPYPYLSGKRNETDQHFPRHPKR